MLFPWFGVNNESVYPWVVGIALVYSAIAGFYAGIGRLTTYLCLRYPRAAELRRNCLVDNWDAVLDSSSDMDAGQRNRYIVFWTLVRMERYIPFYDIGRVIARVTKDKRDRYARVGLLY